MRDDLKLTQFERDLTRRLTAHADITVPPANSLAIAREAMAARRPVGLRLAWASLRPQVRLVVAIGLLAAALVGTAIVGSQLLDRRLAMETLPSPSGAPLPSPQLDPSLEGTWLATKPDELAIAHVSGPATLSLRFDAGATHLGVTVPPTDQVRLSSTVGAVADGLRIVAMAPSDPVALDGVELAGCQVGDASTYRVDRSGDGLLLTLSAVSDACAARTAVLARTWVRSLGDPNSGGRGVVIDALDQPFTVAIPEGSYSVDRSPGSITIAQPVPEIQFLAYLDPQGFNDPCDVSAGRFEIGPGADAVVAYFRQLDGFTVDSTKELSVDGHRAIRLVIHANADASCPAGARLIGWQTKLDQPLGRSWFSPPGAADDLYLVELPASTVMFEVLPAPNTLEGGIIDSIRFLDSLPTSP